MSIGTRLESRFKAEFLGQIVSVVSGGLLIVLLARLLEPDSYGFLFLAISIFGTIKVLSEFGVGKAAAAYITEYRVSNPLQLKHILRFSFTYNIIVIFAVSSLVFIFHKELAEYIGGPNLTPFLFYGGIFIFFSSIVTYVRLVLQGFEAIEIAAIVQGSDRLMRLLLVFTFIFLGFGAIGALWGYIISFAFTSMWGILYIYWKYYSKDAALVEAGLRKRIAKYSLPLTVTSSAHVLDKQVDTILVGVFAGPLGVAYYNIAKQMTEFLQAPARALGFSVSPSFGSLNAKEQHQEAKELLETSLVNLLLLYIPIVVGIFVVAEPTIQLIFGEDYSGAVPVLQIFSIHILLEGVGNMIDNSLDFLGKAKARSITKGMTGTLNFTLNIVLIPIFGVSGAAVATVITSSIYRALNMYIIIGVINVNIIRLGITTLKISILSIIMGISVFILSSYIEGIPSYIAVILFGVVTWAILAVISGLINAKEVISRLA